MVLCCRVLSSRLLKAMQHVLGCSPSYLSNLSFATASTLRTRRVFFCNFPLQSPPENFPASVSSPGPTSISNARISDTENRVAITRTGGRFSILTQKMATLGFDTSGLSPGQQSRLLCPRCRGGTATEKSFSLTISEDGNLALWKCFRGKCGWNGYTQALVDSTPLNKKLIDDHNEKKHREISVEELGLEPLCKEIVTYFATRMISKETLQRNFVMQQSSSDNKKNIAFTYRRDGVLVNCKYRSISKSFWQERDCEKIFYGLDDVKGSSDVIIVEGEIDKLSMEEAGFRNCVSVPDGAPSLVSDKALPSMEKDTKYQFLWNCKDCIEKASRVVLATDADAPGLALAEELARRIGREKCWRVKWPKKNDEKEVLKDANEVLMYLGADALKEVVESAELYPIRGLFKFQDFYSEIDAYYHSMLEADLGVSTGWKAVDRFYTVVPGELTVISGVPNSGKSEWIDGLLCNINETVGWKFVLCSMENSVREHGRKLLEKHLRKPFFGVRYGESTGRMTRGEVEMGKKWLDDTFHIIRSEKDSLPSIKWILDLARASVLRYGVSGLVIDPYNELDHQRLHHQTETEYVSQMLTMVKRFARHYSCHVWFVAHPRQLHDWRGEAPNLYDISGSAHFINKCDNGIVVHRNRNPDVGPLDRVKVSVLKVRNKVAGTIGDAYLSYDRVTGRYMDVEDDPSSC